MFRYCKLALLTGVVFVSASDASAHYAPQAPKGEPPIVKVKIDLVDKTVFRQFFDLPARTSPEFSGTIADRYRLLGDRPDPLLPRTLMIACRIEPAGLIDESNCETDGSDRPDVALALRAARLAGAFRDFPRFRDLKIKKGRQPFSRFVRFELRTPQVSPVAIDFERGPLVEIEQIPALYMVSKSHPSISKYPPRALREGKGGRGLVECQVQEDLSIACRMVSFEPVENAPLFFRSPRQFFDGLLADSKLASGGDARRVRTRVYVNWSIPGEVP